MDNLHTFAEKPGQESEGNDYLQQLIISFALGATAFITFCFLRPRWRGLYAARKQQKDAAAQLPELPDTFFGWIPVLWRITDKEVLGAAGLDAFVFLSFFRMAIKFLAITLFFALVVITPIHAHFTNNIGLPPYNTTETIVLNRFAFADSESLLPRSELQEMANEMGMPSNDYMWMYVVFVYLFSGIAVYLLLNETKKIIQVRQGYLGSQSTITDRTIRLSGIPPNLQSEEKLKEFIETLEIGEVESVTLCRDWRELDNLMDDRASSLRQLEEAWTVHLGKRRIERNLESLPALQPPPPEPTVQDDDDDEEALLLGSAAQNGRSTAPNARTRPMVTIRSGWFSLQSRKIDAIHYFEEKVRKLDEKIMDARKKDYKPTPLAFVTMGSTASCQMAIQAILDPVPLQLTANLAPAPTDVVWPNTYISRNSRMMRAWLITAVIVVLTIFWSLLEIPLAGLLSLESIRKVVPGLANALEGNSITKSLVQSSLPTLVWSLLNLAVPYLYDWLSNQQGMISQADVELSVISKNFFFTFFNLFLVFTVFGTASRFLKFVDDDIQDLAGPGRSRRLDYLIQKALELAQSLESLSRFYVDLIILQGIGLFPFRLLEFGSVAMYPVQLIGSKTPRDYAELVQPPIFMYGLYLPQTILIFIVCIVYSVLKASWLVLLFGLIYFMIGHFTYKYQLLYAMDHSQHSTGKAWPMIGIRVILGLIVFQIAMTGYLLLQGAFVRSVLVLLLLIATIWFSYFFRHTYEPFTRFIALRSISRDGHPAVNVVGETEENQGQFRYRLETRNGQTVDEARETGLRYINPSLIMPLEDAWIARKRAESAPNGRADESASDNNNRGGDENV
ncbi:MAG: hypothetical protein M1835_004446 [Candelina submexicana]|nr:MAG: hypothetical protein M1835_004446 [Candelina submexicana]